MMAYFNNIDTLLCIMQCDFGLVMHICTANLFGMNLEFGDEIIKVLYITVPMFWFRIWMDLNCIIIMKQSSINFLEDCDII